MQFSKPMSFLWIFLFFIFLISTEVIARQKSKFYSPIQMNSVKSSNSGTLSKSGNQQYNILRIGNRRILTCSTPQGCCFQDLCVTPPSYGGGGYYPGYGGGGYPGYGGGGYPGYGGGGYPYPPKSVDEKKKKRLEKKAKQVEEVHN